MNSPRVWMRMVGLQCLAAALAGAMAYAEPVWSVSPALEGGSPSIQVGGLEENQPVTLRVYDLEQPEHELHSVTARAANGAHGYILPSVATDTAVRLEAWVGDDRTGDPAFVWSTLLRPDGASLFDYRGRGDVAIPDDFDEYWERAKEELAAVPMNAEVRELEWGHTETGLLYEVHLDTIGDQRIVVRVTVPRAARDAEGNVVRQFPAMVVMPGYGAEQPPMDRTPSGFVTMSVNPRHHGPSRQYWTAPTEHLVYGIDDPETYYYRFAYMDNLRAAEYLFSMPEVDPTRVAAEGGSQGGMFSIALGALEPRIAAVVSNVTALGAISDGMLLNERGTTQSLRGRMAVDSPEAEAIRLSLSYVDAANMATRLRAPLQVNMGGQDPVCHFLTGLVILHHLRVDIPREYHLFPNAKHEVPGTMRQRNAEWVKRWLDLDEAPSFPGRILSPPRDS